MQTALILYGLILAASALMVLNILRYVRFMRTLSGMGGWEKSRHVLLIPLALLVFFLAGYLAVCLFGKPDPVISGILFGGSVFVFLILNFMDAVISRVRQNEQLKFQLDAARQTSAAKSAFLSNMSHDIRTPLNAIIGFTALAEREGTGPDEMRQYLSKIGAAGRQLLALVNDVLEMSRIESGKLEPDPAPADLCQILEEVRDLFAPQMAQKGLAFSMDGTGVAHRDAVCDRAMLQRVFMNLVSNAFKFTPEGGRVSLRACENPMADGRSLYEFRVRDTGIGMSPEFAERVFSAFERERTSTVSGIQGSGLGMAITKRLVELMGGTIALTTAPGEGTEFTVSLPLTRAPAQARGCGGAPKPDAGPVFSGRRVLLAEDIAVNREIAAALLADAGFEVDTAEDGREAVGKVAGSPAGTYDAVLMDIQMPVMDGYEAARAIRALPDEGRSHVPILALTANAFAEDRQKAGAAGMNGHVSKPIDPAALMRALEEVLEPKN